jgi:hypothetical protein
MLSESPCDSALFIVLDEYSRCESVDAECDRLYAK